MKCDVCGWRASKKEIGKFDMSCRVCFEGVMVEEHRKRTNEKS